MPLGRAATVAVSALLSVAAGCAVGFPITAAHATVIAQDSFAYAAGSSLAGQNGGTGWSGGWYKASGGNTFGNLTIGASSLGYAGLASSGGDAVGQAGGVSHGSTDARRLAAASNTYGNVVWLSFAGVLNANGYGFPNLRLMDNGALTGGIGGNSLAEGQYLTVWSLLNSSLSASGSAKSTTSLSNQTDLALVEINYLTGTTSLWMNPTVGSFDASQAASATLDAAPVFNSVGLFLRGGDSVDELTLATTSWQALQLSAPVVTSGTSSVSNVPEPSSLATFAAGLLALGGLVLARRRRSVA